MPTSIADLFVTVGSDVSGALNGLSDVDRGVNSLSDTMSAAAPAGYVLAGAATAVGAGFVTSIGAASDFEHQINGIKAVMSPSEVLTFGDAVSDLALKLGKDTVFSASQAAQGIEEMIKAGVPLPAILGGAAASALDLAAATGVQVTQAATLASTAINTYHQSAAQLPAVMNTIANVSNATAISVGGLQLALQAVGPVAAGIGLSFTDTATALGIFANNGLIGSDAGTSLKTMLLNLEPSTKAQKAAFEELGITTGGTANKFFDANQAARPMSEIFQVLKESTAGLTAEQKINLLQTAFGTDAVRAATIAASEGAAGWDAVTAAMEKMGGTQVAAAQRMSGLSGALSQLSGSFEAIQITVGTFFLPVLTQLALLAGDVLDAFSDLDPALQLTIVTVVGVAGAVAGLVSAWVLLGPTIGSVVLAFGPLLTVIAPLVIGLKLLSDAGALLYQAWQANFGGIQELTGTVWTAVQTFLSAFGGGLGLLTQAMQALQSGDFSGFLEKIQAAVQAFASAFGPALSQLVPVVLAALGQLAGAIADWAATTGLPQLGAWATAFIEWVTPLIPTLLAKLGELASAVLSWVATVGVPNLLAWASAFIEWVGPMIPPLLAELGKIASAVFTWVSTVGVPNLLAWGKAFLDWVVPLIPPLLTELGKILASVVSFVVSALPPIISAVLEWATAFLEWVGPLIPPLLVELGKILFTIANWILGTALPAIIPLVLQWATAFLSWVAPLIPPLLLQLAGLLATIATWIVGTALPILVDQVLLWAGPFLNFVLAVIPPLLLQLAQLLASIVIWIVGTALPSIVSSVLQWGTAFVGWVVPIIPVLLLELAQVLASIAGWIIGTALPLITQQVFLWGAAFINWAGATIPPLLNALAGILVAIANWVVGTALPLVTGYVLQWAGPFLAWIAPLIPPMLLELANILAAIAGWVVGTALPILTQQLFLWGGAFIQWIGATIPPMLLELGNILVAIANWIISTALPEIIGLTLMWVGPFLSWIKDGVIPQLGPALGNLATFIGDSLAAVPAIIISVLGDPWAPFVNGTFGLGGRIAAAIGTVVGVISENLEPVLLRIADAAATVENMFLGLPEPMQNVILAVAGLTAAWTVLGPAVTAAGGVLLGLIATVLSPVGLAITGMAVVAAGLYAAWQDNFGGIRDVTAEVWTAIQPAFQNIVDFINMIRDKLAPMFSDAQSAAGPFIEQLSQALTPILAQLPGLVRAIGDAFNLLSGVFDVIGPKVEMVAQVINFLITGNLDRLVELMQEGLPQEFAAGLQLLHDVFATSLQVAGDLLGGIKTFIDYLKAGDVQGAFDSLVATFGKIGERIQPLWNEFLQVLGNLLANLPGFIAARSGDIWAALVNGAAQLPARVGEGFSALFAWLRTWAGQIGEVLLESGGDFFAAIPAAAMGLAAAVGEGITELFGWLRTWAGQIGDVLVENGGDFFVAIPAAAMGLASAVGEGISNLFTWLRTWAGQIGEVLLENGGDFFRAIPEAAAGLAAAVGEGVANLFGWLRTWVGQIGEILVENGGDFFGAIPTAAAGLVEAVGQHIAALFDWLRTWASQIPGVLLEGGIDFFGGIVEAAGRLTDRLKEILGPAVQAVKDLFGAVPAWFGNTFGGGTGGAGGGGTGGFDGGGTIGGSGPAVVIQNVYISSEAEMQAFYEQMSLYIEESTGRVSATLTAALPSGA